MPPRLAQLLRRFSPSRIRLGPDGASPLAGGGTAGALVLVARPLCLFMHADASAVPLRQRSGFIALQVRRNAPFNDPEHDLVWFGDHAAVWYWSRSRVRELAGVLPARTRFRAEACYRGEVLEQGLELLALRDDPAPGSGGGSGMEARYWRDGHIVSSRWWPAAPTPAQWLAFLRGSGLDPSTPAPDAVQTGLREQPIGGQRQGSHLVAGQLQAYWPMLAVGASAAYLALLMWQLASIARVQREASLVEGRISALERHLESVITARTRADDAAARIDSMLALRPPASQTRLLGEIRRLTPGDQWQIVVWRQPGPETLEVTLRGTSLDTSALVTAWEESPLLQDVSPATGAGADGLTLRARVTPRVEPAP